MRVGATEQNKAQWRGVAQEGVTERIVDIEGKKAQYSHERVYEDVAKRKRSRRSLSAARGEAGGVPLGWCSNGGGEPYP